LKDGSYAEAVKAIALKITFESDIQGGRPEERIRRMLAAIPAAPAQIHPRCRRSRALVLAVLPAEQVAIPQPHANGETPSDDFTTWDLPRLFAEIDRWFSKASRLPKSSEDAGGRVRRAPREGLRAGRLPADAFRLHRP